MSDIDRDQARTNLDAIRAQQQIAKMYGGHQPTRVQLAQDKLVQTLVHDTPKQVFADINPSAWQGKADTVGQTMVAGRPSTYIAAPVASAISAKLLGDEMGQESDALLNSIHIGNVNQEDQKARERKINEYTTRLKEVARGKGNAFEKAQKAKNIYSEFQNDMGIKAMYENKALVDSDIEEKNTKLKDLNLTGDYKNFYLNKARQTYANKGGTFDENGNINYYRGLAPSKVVDETKKVRDIVNGWRESGTLTERSGTNFGPGGMFKADWATKDGKEWVSYAEVEEHARKMLKQDPEYMAHVRQKIMVDNDHLTDEQLQQKMIDQHRSAFNKDYAKTIIYKDDPPLVKKQKTELKAQLDEVQETAANNIKQASREALMQGFEKVHVDQAIDYGAQHQSFLKTIDANGQKVDYDPLWLKNLDWLRKKQDESIAVVSQKESQKVNPGETVKDIYVKTKKVVEDSKPVMQAKIEGLLAGKNKKLGTGLFDENSYDPKEVKTIMADPKAYQKLIDNSDLTAIEKQELTTAGNNYFELQNRHQNTREMLKVQAKAFIAEERKNNPNSDDFKKVLPNGKTRDMTDEEAVDYVIDNVENPKKNPTKITGVSNRAGGDYLYPNDYTTTGKTNLSNKFDKHQKDNPMTADFRGVTFEPSNPEFKAIDNAVVKKNGNIMVKMYGSNEPILLLDGLKKKLGNPDLTDKEVTDIFANAGLSMADITDHNQNNKVPLILKFQYKNQKQTVVFNPVESNIQNLADKALRESGKYDTKIQDIVYLQDGFRYLSPESHAVNLAQSMKNLPSTQGQIIKDRSGQKIGTMYKDTYGQYLFEDLQKKSYNYNTLNDFTRDIGRLVGQQPIR